MGGFMPRESDGKHEALARLARLFSNTNNHSLHLLDGQTLLCGIPEPDPLWFKLHWFLGTVFWMTQMMIPPRLLTEFDNV
ncbi:hypothetical protein H2248_001289 [Termitomyces sp. 'cryptogamus']|nr:hypothetical protein H2248_001289 [Termitomyces sp. 'cryptogamus']